ncbi:MAG: hypothetical protein A2W09_01560 [Deltaproteobacteria bacterium RBG_16_50_11]|nr:MAG: hypothetical protein A2W09_01560 [Deltaproteobacteria bacterium RBG_16_50_11]
METNGENGLPRLINVRVVAEALGLSKSAIYSLVHDGDLTAVAIGRTLRFDPRDIRRFVESRRTGDAR